MGLLEKLFGGKSPKDDGGEIVMLCSYPTLGEAHVMRTFLMDNEIPAMVGSEGELYSPIVRSGFPVMIFARDMERATELINRQNEM